MARIDLTRVKINYLTKNELKKFKVIKYSNFEIKFKTSQVKYKEPKIIPEICLLKNQTYNIQVYIPISIKYKTKKIIN